jgi:hypothetical protein
MQFRMWAIRTTVRRKRIDFAAGPVQYFKYDKDQACQDQGSIAEITVCIQVLNQEHYRAGGMRRTLQRDRNHALLVIADLRKEFWLNVTFSDNMYR